MNDVSVESAGHLMAAVTPIAVAVLAYFTERKRRDTNRKLDGVHVQLVEVHTLVNDRLERAMEKIEGLEIRLRERGD